jgi:chromosome segregation ATPase
MSWLWGNETTEQAQIVVSALQGELDEREAKIKALEAALRREQQDLTSALQDEVKALEARRARVAQELADLDALLKGKQKQLARAKDPDRKKKKAKKKEAKKQDENANAAAANGALAAAESKDAAPAATPKNAKKKEAKPAVETPKTPKMLPKTLPMDENLGKVAKEDPNVAFIIQRSTVRPPEPLSPLS